LGRVSPKEYRAQLLTTDQWGFTRRIWLLPVVLPTPAPCVSDTSNCAWYQPILLSRP